MPAKPVPRAERLVKILALRDEGLTPKHIAQRLGIAVGTVRGILSDPDGSKARALKKRYQGVCVECGGATNGSNGPGTASLRCNYCAHGWPRPKPQPDRRRRVPVRLSEIPMERRLEAAREACKVERGDWERQAIFAAAVFPSDEVHWVAA